MLRNERKNFTAESAKEIHAEKRRGLLRNERKDFTAESAKEIHAEGRRGLLRNERRKEILTQRKYKRNTRRGTQRIATQ